MAFFKVHLHRETRFDFSCRKKKKVKKVKKVKKKKKEKFIF